MTTNEIEKIENTITEEMILKQVQLNIKLEEILKAYEKEAYKTKQRVKAFNANIYSYKKKIDKYSKLRDDNNINKVLYFRTCENMINVYNDNSKRLNSELDSFLADTKEQISMLLHSSYLNGDIIEASIIEKDGFNIYYLPTAKIKFTILKPTIKSDEILFEFLLKNDLMEEYTDGGNILKEKFLNDISIDESGGLFNNKYGLILRLHETGVCISTPEIYIIFNNN